MEMADIAANKPEPNDKDKPDALGLVRAWRLHRR
jgi:hypothetical protein